MNKTLTKVTVKCNVFFQKKKKKTCKFTNIVYNFSFLATCANCKIPIDRSGYSGLSFIGFRVHL